MTDAAKPPKRRRRKVIVAFVVLVSLVLAWWHWPRGDARLIGKWSWQPESDGKSAGTFDFRPDGWMTFVTTGGETTVASWQVSDDRLHLGQLTNSPEARPGIDWLSRAIQKLTGTSVIVRDGRTIQLLDFKPNRILIRDSLREGEFSDGQMVRLRE